jgi:ketosteroid isomerase-like protein
MSKRIGKAIAVTSVALLVIVVWRAQAPAVADYDQEIRMLQDRLAAAIRAKDIDKIMACYINSPKLVVFDVIPPRQYTGWDAYKANWQGFLAQCSDSPSWETSDLHVQGGQGFAFSHSIQHAACSLKNGSKMDLVLRVTDCYANFKGKWLIAHEHISVPVDVNTAKADLQSKP